MSISLRLSERDIEEWLYQNPQEISPDFWPFEKVKSWIGRQYRLPSGIADLIAFTTDRNLAVIEVKNVPIDKAALAQVARYRRDIEDLLSFYPGFADVRGTDKIIAAIVGPSIDGQTAVEAEAMNISIILFRQQFSLDLKVLRQEVESDPERWDMLVRIAERPEWNVLGPFVPPPTHITDTEFDALLDAPSSDASMGVTE